MTIRLRVNGQEFENFESVTTTISLDTLCNTFSFTSAASPTEPFPIKWFDEVEILVNDVLVTTGFVENLDIDYDETSHTVVVAGRDRTADLLDSDVDIVDSITAPISLKAYLEVIIKAIGSDLKVVLSDGLVLDDFNKSEDFFTFESGEEAWEYAQTAARKRQVLLTSNGAGDVLIADANNAAVLEGVLLQNLINDLDNTNNIKSGSVSYDSTEIYNKYVVTSQLDLTSAENAGKTGLETVVNQRGEAISASVRAGRQLVVPAETASSSGQDIPRAEWEANVRIARSRVFTCVVQGHSDVNGDLWQINTKVPVTDDFAGISSQMLINSLTFDFDQDSGSTTSINLMNNNAYTLNLLEDEFNETAVDFL